MSNSFPNHQERDRSAEKPTSREHFYERVRENLLGFPVVGILCYLAEMGLYEPLSRGWLEVNDQAEDEYGPAKMLAGNLGFLYAIGVLDKSEDGSRYVLPEKTIITPQNLESALSLREDLRRFDEGLEFAVALSTAEIPEELRAGLAVPLLSLLQQAEEADSQKPTDELAKLLAHLDLGSSEGLNEVAEYLQNHRVIGSFRQLTHSYHDLINHLTEASHDPDSMKFGGEHARKEDQNAEASNRLIANIVERLKVYLHERNINRVLDLGSGGGFFSKGLGLETILFDRSLVANQHAHTAFADQPDLLKGVVTGSILDQEALTQAAELEPEAVTINYIIHDILGQAASFEEGLAIVKEFLNTYREVFGDTPLLITESWKVNWDDLRQGDKPYITLYTWLHAISPQRLVSPELLKELLSEAGFVIEDELINGTMTIDGVETPINQTWVVIAR